MVGRTAIASVTNSAMVAASLNAGKNTMMPVIDFPSLPRPGASGGQHGAETVPHWLGSPAEEDRSSAGRGRGSRARRLDISGQGEPGRAFPRKLARARQPAGAQLGAQRF